MSSASTKPLGERLFDWARPKKKYLYAFSEGSLDERNILGNKGANLCEMVRLNLPVPPGFIIATECCLDYLTLEGERKQNKLNEQLVSDYKRAVADLEKQTGKKFAMDEFGPTMKQEPLLLAVRSGAAVSMPGMMGTVLNVGINEQIVEYMAQNSQNPRWAYDTYRRFLQMFGNIVYNMDLQPYEDIVANVRKARGVEHDSQLTAEDLQEIVRHFKLLVAVPDDPWEQLHLSIEAVFKSWNSPRARKYRDVNSIPQNLGTAVTVMSMVYGNLNDFSGSGVAFSRNPTTGAKELYGEYLTNAVGEDVVAGIRTPMKLSDLRREQSSIYDQLRDYAQTLEHNYRDVQDMEFTIENKTLYVVQTRTAKRTPRASVFIAVDMVKEKMITERDALMRIDPNQMDFFLHSMIDKQFANPEEPATCARVLCRGLPASAGAVVGRLAFTAEQVKECKAAEEPCILVREETSADDYIIMEQADGVLTLRGGLTSHAAVVMRGMGKSAVVGANKLQLDSDAQTLTCSICPEKVASHGDIITLDGSTGYLYFGELPLVSVGQDDNFRTVMQWADRYKRMGVLANAENPAEVEQAGRMGAEGIGLCRTEHMFRQDDRLDLFRRLILAQDVHERSKWLLLLLPLQQADFLEIFKQMGGNQVTIRLLDPPLHEFMPSAADPDYEDQLLELSKRLEIPLQQVQQRMTELKETNPMLGFRGCRLSIVYPEITEMQTKAIVGAAIEARKANIEVKPQIMIPFVISDHELEMIIPAIHSAASLVCNQTGGVFSFETLQIAIGAMLETPRACVRTGRIVEVHGMDFVSVGTNDLTQLVFGFSRDGCELFMPHYLEKGLLPRDPFESVDGGGVGFMIEQATKHIAKSKNKDITVGVCGEHAGDPRSIGYFEKLGVHYVSCSPNRIPIAKVAAAQARIAETSGGKQPSRAQDVFQKATGGTIEAPF